MEPKKDSKRRKDKQDEDEYVKNRRSKRPRSRSQSPVRYWDDTRRKRKNSRSRSPDVKREKAAKDPKDVEPKKEVPERKAKDTDMLNTRTGGAYIPPARLRMMQAQITDKSSVAYQRLAWEALKKSVHGHINKINVGNIGIIIKELLKENIVRGRGLLCRSVIQAQAASPTFTNVYAALVAAVNSRFPNIGELLLKRLVIQFKRGFKRNDKAICISSASFIAHLVNQRVAHEILALELLTLLVESPTDDSVEVAIAFLKECGQKLTEVSSKGVNAIFEMLRNILHEGQLDKRVQYMIEVMFQIWKDGFKDHPALIEELELVPEEEQFTHLLMLDDATDPQDILNVFKFDEKYEENEQKYKTLSKEILGSDAESGEEDGSGDEDGSEEESEEEEAEGEQKGMTIIDNTETNLVALRRTIYLTINSSLDFEECAHKLMKMQLKPGQESELCHMFLDCCAEQRTYEKFYGLLAQRFCNINRIYIGPFEEIFKDSYGTAHRLDTNRLRNVSKFFAHLLFTDSISWEVMECVKLNEEDTTSSSRIYIKILFQELAEYMGLKKLNDRLKDPTLQEAFSGIFPRDNPKNTRFSINFFTSIGLGGLTDELREHLKQMPKNVPAPVTEINVDSESDSDSSSSSSSSSDDSSDSSSSNSDEENKKKKKSKKDKNKEKEAKSAGEPETDKNKNTERWGHDGFYDTYGKDARRMENRPERDADNFVMPREVNRRNDNNRYNRDKFDRNYERRNDGYRSEERNGHSAESDRRNRDGRSENRREEENRRSRDDRSENRREEGDRRKRDDRSDDRNDGRDRRNREERSDNRREESDKRNREERNDSKREESDRRNRSDKRDTDQDRRQDYQNRDRNDNGSKARRDDERDSKHVDSRRDEDDNRRSRRDIEDRNEGHSRRRGEDLSRNKRDEKIKNIGGNDSSDEDSRNKREDRKRRDADSDEDRSRSKNNSKGKDEEYQKNRKKDKKRNVSSEESSDEEKPKNKKDSRKKREEKKRTDDDSSDEDLKDKKRDKKHKKGREDSSSDSEEESRHKKKSKNKKKKNKDKDNSREVDGWDIRRGSSIRRELEHGSRYWENK